MLLADRASYVRRHYAAVAHVMLATLRRRQSTRQRIRHVHMPPPRRCFVAAIVYGDTSPHETRALYRKMKWRALVTPARLSRASQGYAAVAERAPYMPGGAMAKSAVYECHRQRVKAHRLRRLRRHCSPFKDITFVDASARQHSTALRATATRQMLRYCRARHVSVHASACHAPRSRHMAPPAARWKYSDMLSALEVRGDGARKHTLRTPEERRVMVA